MFDRLKSFFSPARARTASRTVKARFDAALPALPFVALPLTGSSLLQSLEPRNSSSTLITCSIDAAWLRLPALTRRLTA